MNQSADSIAKADKSAIRHDRLNRSFYNRTRNKHRDTMVSLFLLLLSCNDFTGENQTILLFVNGNYLYSHILADPLVGIFHIIGR